VVKVNVSVWCSLFMILLAARDKIQCCLTKVHPRAKKALEAYEVS